VVVDGAIGDAAAAVGAFASRPLFGRSDEQLCTALVDLQALSSLTTAVMAAIVHEAVGRDLPKRLNAVSTVGWLRDLLHISPHDARQLVTLGDVLDSRPVLADAVACGVVNPGQAVTIGRILHEIPVPDLASDRGADPAGGDDVDLVHRVESTLLGYASRFEPALLHQLGQRVLAHLDPELYDRRLRERLEREERRARSRRGLTLSSDGLGGIRISGLLDVAGAAIVSAALEPLSAPHRGADGPDARSAAARRADALLDICQHTLTCDRLPDSGGGAAQLTITIDWDALRRDVAIGQLDTGALLTAETTRRLACTAQLLPAVLDGHSVPIDLGRSRRLFTGAARHAVLLRDGGCAFPGSDKPPRWAEIHHIVAWQHGGPTNRDNGVALCRHHHRLIHHESAGWTVRLGPDKKPEFLPPTHLDPHRTPQRNPYHDRR